MKSIHIIYLTLAIIAAAMGIVALAYFFTKVFFITVGVIVFFIAIAHLE